MPPKIVIIGAGPTGLGAAYRLAKAGYRNWEIFEKNDYVGGLSSSSVDDRGFTWDMGGHVMFSQYAYFNQLVNRLLKDDKFRHQRSCKIRLMDRWIPYPFQNNIRHLPDDSVLDCVNGLLDAMNGKARKPKNFFEWQLQTFGSGITKLFMEPYNHKVWAIPPQRMSFEWIAERVSVVDIRKVLTDIIMKRDDTSWGPNNEFTFPGHGGTGGLFNRFLPHIKRHLRLNSALINVDTGRKTLRLADGRTTDYDWCINTAPLDDFVQSCTDAPVSVKTAAKKLSCNSVHVIGVGLQDKKFDTPCWMYFPDSITPFYRVTNFSKYSPNNVPDGDTRRFSSLLCEIAFTKNNKTPSGKIIKDAVKGLVACGLLEKKDKTKIVSTFHTVLHKAYPIPTPDRNRALSTIQRYMGSKAILSRGRFGAWRYEIGNMDHSFMQGVEAIDRILYDKDENTIGRMA